jgi:hypothetical protein
MNTLLEIPKTRDTKSGDLCVLIPKNYNNDRLEKIINISTGLSIRTYS